MGDDQDLAMTDVVAAAAMMTTVQYEGEQTVQITDLSKTLLEIALDHEIPHMHACGGHARCSTCRVMISEGANHLTPRQGEEEALAQQRGLPPEVRLACQTHITGDVRLRRLVQDDIDLSLATTSSEAALAREVELAVLFSDLRSFTPFVERLLPYDVVHILNRYFSSAGQAILDHGGYIDKYIGDAIMALFGLDDPEPAQACRNAVLAAQDLVSRLDVVNAYVSRHFGETLRCGVGVHFGTVLVGQIGHPQRMQFTAIGDAVNVASRIESMTKTTGDLILVSDAIRRQVPDLVSDQGKIETQLKGKTGTFELYAVSAQEAKDDETCNPCPHPVGHR